ncbi:uncharacterized protein [Lolium perenne]|uniref:uncharacterized protein n=1 Tax=Lolium perenne TaxID=4522 RepID=UPI0021F597C4|nr:uncharacterized protein LOC127332818 [Lolium perenne]
MATLALEPFGNRSRAPPISPRLSVAREKSEITGRDLGAAPAAGAKMNKGKIVKIAVASVLAMLLLAAAAVSLACYDGAELRAFFGSDNFLMICVGTHLASICLLARCAATAPTPAARRYYADSAVASSVHLAANLYCVLVACPKKVHDCA